MEEKSAGTKNLKVSNSQGKMSRREFLFLAAQVSAASAAGGFLGGCTPSSNLPQSSSGGSSTSGVTLNMIGEALPPLESLNRKKAAFEQETGIKVVIEQYGIDQVLQKTTADFAANTGIYDLYLNPHVSLATHVLNGWVHPLDDFLSKDSLKDPQFDLEKDISNHDWMNACFGYKGKLYGVPFSVHTIYLNWRWDMFEHPEEQKDFADRYGYALPSPPLTMKEFRDTSEFFTRKKGDKLMGQALDHDVYGTTLPAKRHISTLWCFFNVLYAFDGNVVASPTGDDYGPMIINSPEGIAALEYYKDMVRNYCPPGTSTYTWDEQLAALQTGLSASALLWADASYAISEDAEQSQAIGKMAYSGVPIEKRKSTNLHGWGLFIPTSSKNPEAAWRFLQWTQRPDVQAEIMSTGGISLNDSPYQEASVSRLTYAPTHYFIVSGKVLQVNGKESFREPGAAWGLPKQYYEVKDPKTGLQTAEAFKLDRFPEHVEMDNILMKHISECLTSDQDPKTTLDKAVDEVRKSISKLA